SEHLTHVRQNGQHDGVGVTELWGKEFPVAGGAKSHPGIPSTRGLHPSILITKLTELLRDTPNIPHQLSNGRLSEELDTIEKASGLKAPVAVRMPAFCPGCPHRDSSSALLEVRENLLNPQYMQEQYGKQPMDLVAHGDTGCYTMMM